MKFTKWERSLYTNKNIPILLNTIIREYDIQECGFSILKKEHMLTKQEIKKIENMEKQARNVYIGNIQKNKKYAKCINDNLLSIRKEFQISNVIDDEDILSIKKDAFFIIQKAPLNLSIQGVNFICKNKYDTYVLLNNVEFYIDTNTKVYIQKNLGKTFTENKFLEDLFLLLTVSNNKNLFYQQIKTYRHKYINRLLNIESYREANTDNCFSVKIKNITYKLDYYDDINTIDIMYNYENYLQPLYKLIMSM